MLLKTQRKNAKLLALQDMLIGKVEFVLIFVRVTLISMAQLMILLIILVYLTVIMQLLDSLLILKPIEPVSISVQPHL